MAGGGAAARDAVHAMRNAVVTSAVKSSLIVCSPAHRECEVDHHQNGGSAGLLPAKRRDSEPSVVLRRVARLQ